jgi:Na+/H+ antiporter NhaD/arsenite permease-like protein
MPREAPTEIRKQLKRWGREATLLRCLNLILGAVATLASVLVAAKLHSFPQIAIEWIAIVAAGSAALLTSLDTGPKANRTRNAWRRLNAAVILYESEGKLSIEQLVEEYKEAEFMIGDVTIKPQ